VLLVEFDFGLSKMFAKYFVDMLIYVLYCELFWFDWGLVFY